MKSKVKTLGQFDVPIPLHCHHCDRKLPKRTVIEINAPYIVAQCPKCGCLTPFKVEAAA